MMARATRPEPVEAESELTDAEKCVRWIKRFLRVPEGKYIGQEIELREWQVDALRAIYDNPVGTRRAILSFARKNGKTAFAAMLLLLHLCGPRTVANSQLYSAAQSREQAAVLFALAAKMIRMSPVLSKVVRIVDSEKRFYCERMGTTYRALSADASTAYGLSPIFICHDELGQVKGPKSMLYEALETATSAQETPLSIIISTQAPTDNDLLSKLIDDGMTGADPRVVVKLYTAPPDMDPFSDEAIQLANPAFGDFQNATEVRAMAEDARRLPSREPEYRNLVLNQRVDMSAPFISASVWQGCGGEVIDSFKGLPVYGGLDLSEVSDLTALVLVAQKDDIWHVRPTFWLPGSNIRERTHTDRVPYQTWASQGWIETTQGPTVDYEYVAWYLYEEHKLLDIRKIAFDEWNFRHLKPWLLKAGFTEMQLEGDYAIFQPMRQGFKTMGPALRDLESMLLNKRIAHGMHPVLQMCAQNATVDVDPTGAKKLSKIRSHGRIDGMQALAMAMSVAGTYSVQPAPSYEIFLVA
jgi:phage terminase large subunit-like protein